MSDAEKTPINDSQQAEEFTRLYADCRQRLFVYISMLMPNSVDAHDVLQDTNLVLWQKFDHFEPGSSFFAWAREIARYRVLRYRQIHARDAVPVDTKILEGSIQQACEEDVEQAESRRQALASCIEKLKSGDRDLIQLRYAPGVTVKAIAVQASRSENAISQSLGRIRRLLRDCVTSTLDRDASEGDT